MEFNYAKQNERKNKIYFPEMYQIKQVKGRKVWEAAALLWVFLGAILLGVAVVWVLMLWIGEAAAQDFPDSAIENPDEPTIIVPAPPLIQPPGAVVTPTPVPEPEPIVCVPESDVFYMDAPTNAIFGLQTWRDHYGACLLHNFQLQIELGKCTPSPEPLPACSDFLDGPGGALWKPISHNTGNPVALLPPGQHPSDCHITDGNGSDVGASCKFHTIANGGRSHYYVNKPASTLPRPTIVHFSDGTCRQVDDPEVRND